MKNFAALLLFALIRINASIAQSSTTDSLYIIKTIDIMEDKTYYSISQGLLLWDDVGKRGFAIRPSFTATATGFKYGGIIVKSSGIGNCQENDKLIFLFEDDSKVTMSMWNKFNCDGNSYFDFNNKELTNLNKPIKAIRYSNGRTYDSYTPEVLGLDKNYFITINQLVEQQIFQVVSSD